MSMEQLDAGNITQSPKRYIVTFPHKHKTLVVGDVVVLVENSRLDYFLLRVADMTLHVLKDDHGQYVHLKKE